MIPDDSSAKPSGGGPYGVVWTSALGVAANSGRRPKLWFRGIRPKPIFAVWFRGSGTPSPVEVRSATTSMATDRSVRPMATIDRSVRPRPSPRCWTAGAALVVPLGTAPPKGRFVNLANSAEKTGVDLQSTCTCNSRGRWGYARGPEGVRNAVSGYRSLGATPNWASRRRL